MDQYPNSVMGTPKDILGLESEKYSFSDLEIVIACKTRHPDNDSLLFNNSLYRDRYDKVPDTLDEYLSFLDMTGRIPSLITNRWTASIIQQRAVDLGAVFD